ncbi:hypothetical protein SmJEL517_g05751 [Synchytrium microbalum]|uniref:WLM domain-containing protein n=1 Tax=Synchytrium microbalum TaxID=1806994 RepID=A0A507BUW6_9FUNG|nr:uncharacterized protein SmJEL517_g05751 [Synchytrium microbalum]TPX30769.1 hypothetical protein SmJEL517_g05751 [Synchytrium microbalum]
MSSEDGHSTSSEAPTVSFLVSFKGVAHEFTDVPGNVTIQELKADLQEIFNIPAQNQKLLFKSQLKDNATLLESKLERNSKIILMGTTNAVVEAVTVEAERVKQVLAARTAQRKQASRLKPSQPVRTVADGKYTFHNIEVLPEFSDTDAARKYLNRLKDDVGIRGLMQKYKWSVGTLKELHPLRDHTILGYNENKGLSIALRLRTDRLDGFRLYDSVRKTLLHELAHMVHSEHNNDFHSLNRLLNKQVVELDWTAKGHVIGGSDVYNPEESEAVDEKAFEGGVFVLGGSKKDENRPMREVLAEAALLRLTKEEQDMVDSCGSHPSSHQH